MIKTNGLVKMDEQAIEFDLLKQCNSEKVSEIYERILPELRDKFDLDIQMVEVEFEDENGNIEVKETERVILSDEATDYVEEVIKKEFSERLDLDVPDSVARNVINYSYYYVHLDGSFKAVYTTANGTASAGTLGWGEIFVLRAEDYSNLNNYMIRFMNPSGKIVNAYVRNLDGCVTFKDRAYNLYFGGVHYSGYKVQKQGYLYNSSKVKNGTISTGWVCAKSANGAAVADVDYPYIMQINGHTTSTDSGNMKLSSTRYYVQTGLNTSPTKPIIRGKW